ncbi:MAG: NUDIX domain-containing protein [Acidimicrobiales bacterium]
MSAGAEMVEHVDRDGNVIGIVTRAAVRAGVLRHRCTYVAVIDSADRVVVHRRADWKDVYPGWWDLAFGGICNVGEDWVSAARRELAEEAGLTGEALWPLGRVAYDADDGAVVGEVYLVRSDTEPSCPDAEVVEVDRVPVADLLAWMEGRSVCLDSREVVAPLVIAALGAGR